MRKLTQKDDIQALLVEKRLYIKNNDSYHRINDIKYPIYGEILKFECEGGLTHLTDIDLLYRNTEGVFVKEKSPYSHPVSWTAPTSFCTDGETTIYWDLYKQPNEYLTRIHKAMQRDEENKIFEQIINKTMSKQEIELKEGMTARVEGGKVIIETTDAKFKAGDVVTTISPRGKTISIYKSGMVSVCCFWNFYASIHHSNGFRIEEQMMDYFGDVEIRLSTYDERCTFFARLVAEGYKWNAKKLKLTKVEKWSPADGDFIVAGDGTISVLGKRRSSGDFDVKCRLFKSGVLNDMVYGTYTSCFIKNKATDSERQKLLDALAKAGKRWNAELKMVEDIEFKVGDCVIGRDTFLPENAKFVEHIDVDRNYPGNSGCKYDNLSNGCSFKHLRHATDAEKAQTVSDLYKKGKVWNKKLNCIEDIKPEYKEGDFLRTKGENVLIYKNTHYGRMFDHAFMFSGGGVTISDGPACDVGSISRHATEQEKQKLLDELAKIGKKWNATKKRIEDIEPNVVEMTMEQVCEKLGVNVKIVKR